VSPRFRTGSRTDEAREPEIELDVMIDEWSDEITFEPSEPPLPAPDQEPTGKRRPGLQNRTSRRQEEIPPLYCGDCGAALPPASTRGCCVNRDWRFDLRMPAEVIRALDWDELEGEEQALVVALMNFPDREAREAELLERLQWTSERLYEVAAPRTRQAADFACCLYSQETFRLTDQGRDAFLIRFERKG
jgi:hypothetical protein